MKSFLFAVPVSICRLCSSISNEGMHANFSYAPDLFKIFFQIFHQFSYLGIRYEKNFVKNKQKNESVRLLRFNNHSWNLKSFEIFESIFTKDLFWSRGRQMIKIIGSKDHLIFYFWSDFFSCIKILNFLFDLYFCFGSYHH